MHARMVEKIQGKFGDVEDQFNIDDFVPHGAAQGYAYRGARAMLYIYTTLRCVNFIDITDPCGTKSSSE